MINNEMFSQKLSKEGILFGSKFHLTYFVNCWPILETCQQFVERILVPYQKNEVHELNLPQTKRWYG
jgi:hypothetical protein